MNPQLHKHFSRLLLKAIPTLSLHGKEETPMADRPIIIGTFGLNLLSPTIIVIVGAGFT